MTNAMVIRQQNMLDMQKGSLIPVISGFPNWQNTSGRVWSARTVVGSSPGNGPNQRKNLMPGTSIFLTPGGRTYYLNGVRVLHDLAYTSFNEDCLFPSGSRGRLSVTFSEDYETDNVICDLSFLPRPDSLPPNSAESSAFSIITYWTNDDTVVVGSTRKTDVNILLDSGHSNVDTYNQVFGTSVVAASASKVTDIFFGQGTGFGMIDAVALTAGQAAQRADAHHNRPDADSFLGKTTKLSNSVFTGVREFVSSVFNDNTVKDLITDNVLPIIGEVGLGLLALI